MLSEPFGAILGVHFAGLVFFSVCTLSLHVNSVNYVHSIASLFYVGFASLSLWRIACSSSRGR